MKIIKGNTSVKIFPKDIEKVEIADKIYYSLYFDETDYGLSSYSFAEKIVGNDLMLVKTKFLEKICPCQKYGGIEHGYFLVKDSKIIRIRTDVRQYIVNLKEINKELQQIGCSQLPENVKTIENLKDYCVINFQEQK